MRGEETDLERWIEERKVRGREKPTYLHTINSFITLPALKKIDGSAAEMVANRDENHRIKRAGEVERGRREREREREREVIRERREGKMEGEE